MNIFSELDVTRNSAVPAYYQIENCIKKALENGSFSPDAELPSEEEMAALFKVNRLTVRRAMSELATKGLVIRSQGRRSRVALPKIPLDPFGSFSDQVTSLGLTDTTIVQECRLITPSKDIKRLLNEKSSKKVLHIARIRKLESTPVGVEDNYLLAEFAPPFIEDHSRGQTLNASLRQHCGLTAWDADADAEMRAATSREAACLNVREGHPLFSLRLTLSVQGKTIGLSTVRFLADRFHFRLGLQRNIITKK